MARLSPHSQISYICLFFFSGVSEQTLSYFRFLALRLGPVVSCVLAVFNFHSENTAFKDKRQAHRLLQKSLLL